MEIENNKEEVPFGHYENLFRRSDPEEIADRLGVKFDGKEFNLKLLDRTYAISHPVYGIRQIPTSVTADAATPSPQGEGKGDDGPMRGSDPTAAGGGEREGSEWPRSVNDAGACTKESTGYRNRASAPTLQAQTFLLRYLLEGKKVLSTGNWLTFREMPWGELYVKPYTGRVLTRAAFTFGTRVDAFKAAAEKMGAVPVNHGDAGYQFELVEGYGLRILVWAGDEEFPPNAQVLYSDNFAQGFAAEDRVVAGDILISAIKGNM